MNTIILIILTLIGILFFVFLCIYLYARNQYKFWEKRSIPHSKPKFPTGTFDFGGKKHLAEIFNERYVKRGQNEFLGGFIMFHPTIEVYDVQLAKDIMGKDFNYFTNRGSYVNTRDDPLTGHLFNLEGDQWKVMREKLTHVFTSGKMKLMFELVKNIGEEFVKAIERELKFGNSIDVKEFCARYTTDVIGQCAFGIECNSLVNPDAEFRVIGRKVFKINKFKQLFTFNFQGLARKLKMQLFAKDVINFFVNAIHDLVDYREREKIERFDLIGFMMQKRNKEKTDDASDEMMPGLSMKELVAQAFVFYLAGFETSSTNMSYTLYELALNPEVQEKARKHVFQTIKKHGNSLTYDAIQEMHYLEACINESLRKYPPVPFAFRQCSKDYNLPNSTVVVEKGMTVFIPFYSFHHDPDFFPDPDKFNPDRFLEDGAKIKTPNEFMPFGDGPRICIGLRFGVMQAKIGMASLLMNYKISISPKTNIPVKFDTQVGLLQPLDLYLNFDKL